MVVLYPVGEPAVIALAFACSALFGAFGVLLGLRIGARIVQRDEARYETVETHLEKVGRDHSALRLEWGTALENLEQLAAAVEKGRRRVAASDSRERKLAAQEEQPAPELTPSQQRDEIRRRMRRIV